MKILSKREANARRSSHYKVAQLNDVTFRQLHKLLGKSTFTSKDSGDGKVHHEWVVEYEDEVFCIYDYKTGNKNYTENILTTWSVGGNSSGCFFAQYITSLIKK